jgi:uncharacterized protein (TIGR03437 family)
MVTVAGSSSVGDGGPASSAVLFQVQGIAADAQGNVYLSDTDNHRIRRVAPDGTISTVAGTGAPGFSGDGGPAAAAQIDTPYSLATDPQGNLYFADYGNGRIRRIRPNGVIETIAGGGPFTPNAQTEAGQATLYRLQGPRNVAIARDGTLYISDFLANLVLQVTSGGWLTIAAGNSQPGFAGEGVIARESAISAPAGLAVGTRGELYIAETGTRRVRVVENGKIRSWVTTGNPLGLSTDVQGFLYIADTSGGQILRVNPQGQIAAVPIAGRDVTTATGGVLYIASGGIVRRVGPTGTISNFAGGGSTASGDNGPADQARLSFPSGIARDNAGNVYIADRNNHRIRRVSPDGVISTIAGTGEAGISGDGGDAKRARLNLPSSVAIDGNVLYIADTGNHAIRRVQSSGVIDTLAGTGEPGYDGDNLAGVRSRLNTPSYVIADRQGGILVADTGNHRIRRFLPSGRLINVAGTGKAASEGDGGPAIDAAVWRPRGLALDDSGALYFTEIESGRIRRIAPNGIMQAFGGNGWNSPQAVQVLRDGTVAVAESGANRIRLVRSGEVIDFAGTGKASFSGENGDPASAALNAPSDLLVDSEGRTWVADQGNHRIRRIDPASVTFENLKLIDVRHAATGVSGVIAPGLLVEIGGSTVSPDECDKVSIRFGALPVLPVAMRGNVLLAVAPDSIVPGDVEIEVLAGTESRGKTRVSVASAAPGLFTNGTFAAAVNQDGTLHSESNPAVRGTVLTLYATGLGLNSDTVAARVGDWLAEVLFAGAAPGLTGIAQINIRLPVGFFPAGNYPVTLTIGEVSSPTGVLIAMK